MPQNENSENQNPQKIVQTAGRAALGEFAPHLGVWGIWLATPLSWASGCIIPVVRYYSKEWMKRTLI